MAQGTNVGTVYFSLAIDNQNQIRGMVQNALAGAQNQATQLATSVSSSVQSANTNISSLATSVVTSARSVNASSSSMATAVARNANSTNNSMASIATAAARSAQSTNNSIGSMIKSIGLLTLALYALRKAFQFGKESVQLASDLQEVQNVVDVTYGSMSEQVNEFAKGAMSALGLSEKVAKQYMGSFGAMSKAFGFTTSQAYDMSESLTALAADVASFYNLSSDAAYTKLKSVFTGETESLKDLGVVMTQAALDAYAMENGWNKTTRAMTEQEKVLLRYNFVLDRLSAAQGDFVRTQDGWANQTRVLKLRFDELKATIGEGLIIALTPVVKMLNTIISRLIVAAQAFTNFIKTLFGVKESETSEVADAMSNADEAVSGLASGTAETAKNLAKAKKQLMGFDRLYKLSDNSSSDSDISGGIGDIGAIDGINVGKGETPSLTLPSASELGKKLSEFAVTILKTLKEKLNAVDWHSIGTKIGDFLRAVDWVAIFIGLGEVIFAALNAAGKLWKGMFDAAPLETAIITAIAALKFTPLGGIITSLITNAILKGLGADAGATVGSAIAGWIGKALVGIKGLTIFDWSLVMGAGTLAEKIVFVGKMIGGIGTVIAGAWIAVKNFIDMFINGFGWVKEILMVLGVALAAVGAIILGAPAAIAAVIAAIIAALATLVIVIKDNWKAIAAWEEKWFGNTLKGFFKYFDSIKGYFTGLIDFVAGIFTLDWDRAWNGIKEMFVSTITAITSNFDIALGFIRDIFALFGVDLKGIWQTIANWFMSGLTVFKNGFISVFTAIKDGVVGAFNQIKTAIKTPINAIIRMLNKMIDGINNLNFDMPNWVPIVGGKSLGFKIPKIPELATGGYVKPNNPQLAIIGDNKREGEIVAPESKITEAVNQALIPFINTLVGALRAPQTATAGGGDIVIPVYIGNELLDQYIVNANTKNTYRSGR